MVRTATLELATDGNGQVIDFTEALPGVLYGTGLQHGTATVFCPSATSAVTTMGRVRAKVVSDLLDAGY